MIFQDRGRPQGNINKTVNPSFLKISTSQLEISSRLQKIFSRLGVLEVDPGQKIVPDYPARSSWLLPSYNVVVSLQDC